MASNESLLGKEQRLLEKERARIIENFVFFWQHTNPEDWRSPSGKTINDLGNGDAVARDLAKYIITGLWTHDTATNAQLEIAIDLFRADQAELAARTGTRFFTPEETSRAWLAQTVYERERYLDRARRLYEMATRPRRSHA